MWLERIHRVIIGAFRLTQRVCAALIAGGLVAGIAGAHFRVPRLVLFVFFAIAALALAGLWGRIDWRAFNRLLAAGFLLTLLGASVHLLVHRGLLMDITAVFAPLGAAAAATVAAVGFQPRQPDAKAKRRARTIVACLALGLVACSRWHEQAWRNFDSLVLVTAVLSATLATLATATGGKARPSPF